MIFKVAEGRVEILQIYRLLQFVHDSNELEIERLVRMGVKNLINLTEPTNGTGALHLAVAANKYDLVSFLLSQGAHPDIQDKKGCSPMMMAAEMGKDELVLLLAENDANLRLQDEEGKSVLYYCAYPTDNHLHCVEVALKFKADVNHVSMEGTHVFQLMCERAHECPAMCLAVLHAGADPDASNKVTGVTALMEAAKAGCVELVRAILRKGGDPNLVDLRRHSAVHYAAMGGVFEVLPVLSAFSADMGMTSLEENTPLHFAAAIGDPNCCKFLAQRGCNTKLKNIKGLLPRVISKEAGHKVATKELRKAEKQQVKNSKSISGPPHAHPLSLRLHDWSHEFESDLMKAFGEEAEVIPADDFMTMLQKFKAPIETKQLDIIISVHDTKKEGVVNLSDFFKGNKYITKQYLLACYAPKKKKGGKGGKGKKKKGKPSMVLPICILPPDLIQRRVEDDRPNFIIEKYQNIMTLRGYDLDHPPVHPLMDDCEWYMDKPPKSYVNINYCAQNGDLKSLDLARDHGFPIDVADQFYRTPLLMACASGNYEAAEYLIHNGVDVNVCDQFYWTPLHHAAYAGQAGIIELLLQAGASIDARALNGGTPLMRAIQMSRVECVDLLIKSGANVIAKNRKDLTCLELAKTFEDATIIELVQDGIEALARLKRARSQAKKRAQR